MLYLYYAGSVLIGTAGSVESHSIVPFLYVTGFALLMHGLTKAAAGMNLSKDGYDRD